MKMKFHGQLVNEINHFLWKKVYSMKSEKICEVYTVLKLSEENNQGCSSSLDII